MFLIRSFKMEFYRFQSEHYFNKKKCIVDRDVVNDVKRSRQSVVTRAGIRFL